MKKFVTAMLVASMILSMSAPAFAADDVTAKNGTATASTQAVAQGYDIQVQGNRIIFLKNGVVVNSINMKNTNIKLVPSKAGGVAVQFVDANGKARKITLGTQKNVEISGKLASLTVSSQLPKTVNVQVAPTATVTKLTVAAACKVSVQGQVTTMEVTHKDAAVEVDSKTAKVSQITSVSKSAVSGVAASQVTQTATGTASGSQTTGGGSSSSSSNRDDDDEDKKPSKPGNNGNGSGNQNSGSENNAAINKAVAKAREIMEGFTVFNDSTAADFEEQLAEQMKTYGTVSGVSYVVNVPATTQAEGQATLSASVRAGGRMQRVSVRLTIQKLQDQQPEEVVVKEIKINGVSEIMADRETDVNKNYSATVIMSDGSQGSDQGITWAVTGSTGATISQDGVLTIQPGTPDAKLTITATKDGVVGKLEVTLTLEDPEPEQDPVVSQVEITSSVTELEVGKTATMAAKVTMDPESATPVPVTWSVDNASIATINPTTGQIQGVQAGTVTVTATAGEKTDSVTITVKEKATEPEQTEFEVTNIALQGSFTITTSASVDAGLTTEAAVQLVTDEAKKKSVTITYNDENGSQTVDAKILAINADENNQPNYSKDNGGIIQFTVTQVQQPTDIQFSNLAAKLAETMLEATIKLNNSGN